MAKLPWRVASDEGNPCCCGGCCGWNKFVDNSDPEHPKMQITVSDITMGYCCYVYLDPDFSTSEAEYSEGSGSLSGVYELELSPAGCFNGEYETEFKITGASIDYKSGWSSAPFELDCGDPNPEEVNWDDEELETLYWKIISAPGSISVHLSFGSSSLRTEKLWVFDCDGNLTSYSDGGCRTGPGETTGDGVIQASDTSVTLIPV